MLTYRDKSSESALLAFDDVMPIETDWQEALQKTYKDQKWLEAI